MKTLCDYLKNSSDRYPKAEAVRHKGRSITYAELNKKSDALAATMREGGVRAGDRIAIWLNKSIEGIVAIYATLKCGAGYVPLDPTAPVARASYILRDCTPASLVTDQERLGLLDSATLREVAPRLIVLTDAETTGHAVEGEVGDTVVAAWPEALARDTSTCSDGWGIKEVDQLAYILYTSGSTGVPKGVMLSHRNACAFVEWVNRCFALSRDDRLSSHAPFHFDLSILDLFGAASAAATVVLVPESQQGLGFALNRLVTDEEISIWYSVPTALVRMVEAKNSSVLRQSRLRTVLFAGEVFPVKYLRRLHAAVPHAALYNLYGPTETNVCTFHHVTVEDLAEDRTLPPPIGRTCPYATTFLLDDEGWLVAPREGAEGELCVGGDSVMLGYWGDQQKTERRMVEYPDEIGVDGIAYRTGDIVRHDLDLNYVFVGRRDDMVKVRGHRIDLGEIEATLLGHPDVAETACVIVSKEALDARLEAYVVGDPRTELTEPELRTHCRKVLPPYMLPEKIHLVRELPRTSTGKIDRQELVNRTCAMLEERETSPAQTV
ncbi:amino acid adenylation domain-containing protein [Rubrobacter naiadicus]|uniref:amino acid adenylation domain-containing protein n=1 Tax=Rubrobacter naiadicus TaxID=1392641 RepID=UPI00235EE168|nr:amino acid adenylation domain-containing protein [Rubrobacter naiadicus]